MSQAKPRPCPDGETLAFCNKCGWMGCAKPEEPEEFYSHPGCRYSATPVEARNEREEA